MVTTEEIRQLINNKDLNKDVKSNQIAGLIDRINKTQDILVKVERKELMRLIELDKDLDYVELNIEMPTFVNFQMLAVQKLKKSINTQKKNKETLLKGL